MDILFKMKDALTLQMLHDASETVAMGSDQHPLSLLDLRNNLFVPERQRPGDGVLEALTAGELLLAQLAVTPILEATVHVTERTR